VAGAALTSDAPVLPSGQGYVTRTPPRREQVGDAVTMTLACAALVALGVGLVRLVPVIGASTPGSAWRTCWLLGAYPVVRVLDLAVSALIRRRSTALRTAVHAALTLLALTVALRLYLLDPRGALAAAALSGAALWILVRTTPHTLL
jgi:hypothetical protein